MPNTISSGYNTFVARTLIESAKVNENFTTIRDRTPLWQKYTIPYTSFVALGATTTAALTLCASTAAEVRDNFIVKHSVAFSGAAISAIATRIGIASNDGYFTDDFNVAQTVASDAFQATANLSPLFTAGSIMLLMSVTGGNLSQLSTGSLDIYVRNAELP